MNIYTFLTNNVYREQNSINKKKEKRMKIANLITFIILLIGGINWLSIGIFQFDIVAGLFGSQAAVLSRIIYVIVGLCAVYLLFAALSRRGKLDMCNRERDTIQ